MTLATNASAQSPPASLKAELAPTGTLRAAINYNNPLLAQRNATTGELTGLAVDLARELARRAGLPIQLIGYDAAGKVSAAARTGAWDVAFLGIDPERAADIDFTAAHIELEGTYLVPAGSPLQKIADVDRDGVRIGITSKSAYDLFLTRELKHAQIVHFDNTPQSIDMLLPQKLDAVAAVRTALLTSLPRLPGARILDGHFMTIPQAAGVPKGRPAAARYLREYIEDVKSSGFVAAALKTHGLGPDDAIVAPPAAASMMRTVTYLDVRPASTAAALALAAQYERDTRADAGNMGVDAYQEIGRANRFVIVASWWDQAALADHEKTAHTLDFRQRLKAIQGAPYDQRVNRGFAIDPQPVPAGTGAVYVVTHVDVPGAFREQGEALLKTLSTASRASVGHVRYDVLQQVDPRMNHFSVVAVWSNRAAFDASGSTSHALAFREALAPLLGALYDERIYQPIRK
jgi:polar amino acid transport system substrate-binding protein